jgi:hypothetical protein
MQSPGSAQLGRRRHGGFGHCFVHHGYGAFRYFFGRGAKEEECLALVGTASWARTRDPQIHNLVL